MLRWIIRATAASSYKNKVISESGRAESKAKNALSSFNRAERERDLDKKVSYLAEGMGYLAEAVSHNSNAIEPLAEMSFVASLLTESIQNNLDEQTADIVQKIKQG